MNTIELKEAKINLDLSIKPDEKVELRLKGNVEGDKHMLVFLVSELFEKVDAKRDENN